MHNARIAHVALALAGSNNNNGFPVSRARAENASQKMYAFV